MLGLLLILLGVGGIFAVFFGAILTSFVTQSDQETGGSSPVTPVWGDVDAPLEADDAWDDWHDAADVDDHAGSDGGYDV